MDQQTIHKNPTFQGFGCCANFGPFMRGLTYERLNEVTSVRGTATSRLSVSKWTVKSGILTSLHAMPMPTEGETRYQLWNQ